MHMTLWSYVLHTIRLVLFRSTGSCENFLCDSIVQTRYGILLACCKAVDGRAACIVRALEEVQTPLGVPIMNEFDCPLLSLTHTIFTVKSLEIVKAVSVIHECTESCQFIDKESARSVEREDVTFSRIEFQHDFIGNNMFCLNVYCIGT